jgi:pimeloyl-ACP methyl ester carboxylesterase
LTDSVEAWLDLRALDRPLLVGNSLGCQIAVELLLRRPGSFAGAVLTGPTPDPAAPTLLGQFLRLLHVARHEPIRHDLRVAADYLRHGPLYIVGAARLALRDPVGEKLRQVQDPVAIVRGENDTIASPGWAAHAAGLARGTVHTIAGHGHSVTYSAPGAVAAIALSLLGESA